MVPQSEYLSADLVSSAQLVGLVAATLGVSRQTVYRHLAPHDGLDI
jgi:hypothetical protein